MGLMTLGTEIKPLNSVSLTSAINWGLGENTGLTGFSLQGIFSSRPLAINFGYQYQYWSDWQVGENRGYSLLQFLPTEKITIGLGICRRQMFYQTGSNPSTLFYPEWNLIYLVRYDLLNKTRFHLRAELSNYERLQVKNPQQFPLGINGSYRLHPRWQIFASCRTALNGLSTGLVSFTEIKLESGIKYGN